MLQRGTKRRKIEGVESMGFSFKYDRQEMFH